MERNLKRLIKELTELASITHRWSVGTRIYCDVSDLDTGQSKIALPEGLADKIQKIKSQLLAYYSARGFTDIQKILKPLAETEIAPGLFIDAGIFNDGHKRKDGVWHRPAFRLGWLVFRMYGDYIPLEVIAAEINSSVKTHISEIDGVASVQQAHDIMPNWTPQL